jgi:hypothetical protein
VHLLNAYLVRGIELVNSVWRKTSIEQQLIVGKPRGEFMKKLQKLSKEGWCLRDLNAY